MLCLQAEILTLLNDEYGFEYEQETPWHAVCAERPQTPKHPDVKAQATPVQHKTLAGFLATADLADSDSSDSSFRCANDDTDQILCSIALIIPSARSILLLLSILAVLASASCKCCSFQAASDAFFVRLEKLTLYLFAHRAFWSLADSSLAEFLVTADLPESDSSNYRFRHAINHCMSSTQA